MANLKRLVTFKDNRFTVECPIDPEELAERNHDYSILPKEKFAKK